MTQLENLATMNKSIVHCGPFKSALHNLTHCATRKNFHLKKKDFFFNPPFWAYFMPTRVTDQIWLLAVKF